jgi:serine phosphatase RsbU (regulator of sigma subunit)
MIMPMASPELDLDSTEKLREEELDEARATQSGMLPTQPLRVGGITISHEFQPATLVGGDYLDYFSLPDGMIGMYVGDVPARAGRAMYAALAVGTLRGIHNTGQHPTQVMALLNKRLLLRGNPSRYTAIQPCSTPSQRSCIFRAPECPGVCCCGQENVEF